MSVSPGTIASVPSVIDVLAGRTTRDVVIPREVRVRIAIRIGDRPGRNVRSQAPTECDIQRELGGHVSVGHGDRGHSWHQRCRSAADRL